MLSYFNTRKAADRLGVSASRLSRAVWLGRIVPPAKSPEGSFLWTDDDLRRAAWVLCRRSLEDIERGRK